MRKVCFLDLDGVLVDFVSGALALHGVTLPRSEVRWNFLTQIGFDGINDPRFWSPMGHDFWANLPWTAEGPLVLLAVERLYGADNVALMTSPCDTPGSVEGKLSWVCRELPAYRRRLFVGPAKHLAAGPGKVLVDDHDANVDKFCAAGGSALLVPRPWNRRRGETDSEGRFCVERFAADLEPLRY
jgi:hypothetical protein